ncbi:DUF4380 domain-containing protein [Arenibacter algicola]|uniref:DUF4380 domain-containing protein n=1 Tax=Arenibacter algicola TaxID=616991 RepID=UPI001C065C96|nr:DUF4380 domain-containing protein [Arenibacter algicola]MBU2904109.1 DUF4380 domain-containing protein [Arenibacter algicola]
MIKFSTTKYLGWDAHLLQSDWIKLYLAPQLGGRIMQLAMHDHEFLFVNPEFVGKHVNDSRLGKEGSWLNFGGEKIWPAPQGWDNDSQWPGPPDPILDSGVYTLTKKDGDGNNIVLTLKSPIDFSRGLQMERDIMLSKKKAEVVIKASLHNTKNVSQKWAIWPVCQVQTGKLISEGQFQIICPTATDSKYNSGYKVMHGVVNNPQYSLNDKKQLVVDYKYMIGKVGLDTDSDWVAFLDKTTGKVLIYKFSVQKHLEYPDNTSVQIWTNGIGTIYSRNKLTIFENDPSLTPPYMEIEILSPLVNILPGKKIDFQYQIALSTIGKGQEIMDVNKLGIIVSNMYATNQKNSYEIIGNYGFFYKGILKIQINDADKIDTSKLRDLYKTQVSPLKGTTIKLAIKKTIPLLNTNHIISANLYDLKNNYIGTIDEINVQNCC